MIRQLSIKPIYLAYLATVLSFLIFSWTIWAQLLFLVSLIALVIQYDRRTCLKVFFILLFFGGYCFAVSSWTTSKDNSLPPKVGQVQMIADTVSVNGDRLSFRARSNGRKYQVYYQLTSQAEQVYFQKLVDTMQLSIESEITEAVGQRNFRGFDYQRYLHYQGISGILEVSRIKSVARAKKVSFLDRLAELRRRLIVYSQNHFPKPMSHYVTGLLWGYLDKSFDEMSDLYSDLGIIHLFALSGMQVGFFMGLFRRGLIHLGVSLEAIKWLMLPIGIIYAGITGMTISVIRALLQMMLSQLGLRKWNNFAACLLLMFLLMPYFLMTTGGLLSFAYAFLLTLLDFEDGVGFKRGCLDALSLNLGILPLLTWVFATFQPLAMILTALFSLLFDYFLLPFLTIAFALSPLVSFGFANPLFQLLEDLLRFLGQLVGGSWVFGAWSLGLTFFTLLGLGILSDPRVKRKGFICLLVIACFLGNKHPLQNEVTVVDIGQGDSIFLRDSLGKSILIDVGGRVSFKEKKNWQESKTDANAERTLIPYLKSRGISKLDQLVLTHTDADHIGDLETLLKDIDVGQLIVSPGSLTVPDFKKRLLALHKPIKVVTAGDSLSIMGSRLYVLYPQAVGDGGNNDSLVLYGKLLDKRFLFTGDLEKEGEEQLLATYPHLGVDILKAGHHGSKGSSSPAFLDAIGARVALISVGKDNRYKHPHQETLERFEERGMTVYRTDQLGALRFIGWRHWHFESVR
ncbi:DNA internalization-related competence protein ComEC/Rec2 [Streptococcus saliviloxodontae]|uniref:Competence protein ComEC n=1 Tax=Streptococcus saliviloxodontae TaxID=1349416 RepID=A0ABS2PMJ4_9STRE|nr:DNA internalization-related competence protein ComEC/Rec2 [Streptococcus saliviloxodontae]MBM7636569.1 competence protein ComEC [Streptococcus saliviloxodontae]